MSAAELLFDNYEQSGTSAEDLMYFAKILEKHTELLQIDFSDLDVCHYVGTEAGKAVYCRLSHDGKPHFAMQNGQIYLKTGSAMSFDKANFNSRGLMDLLTEPELDPATYATMFYNQGYVSDGAKYYFTSAVARKTFIARLCPGRPESTMERDMMLRKALYDAVEKPLWTVSRRLDPCAKIVGVFGTKPKRIPYPTLAEYAGDIGNSLAFWRFTQASGLIACFVFQDEVEEIRKDFPDLEFQPCHYLMISDTGHFKDMAINGWFSGDAPENAFFLDRFVITGDDLSAAMEETLDMVREEAAMLSDDSCFSGDVQRTAETICNHSGITKNSVKCANLIKSYASERNVRSRKDFRRIFTDGIKTGAFGDISHYADEKIRTELIHAALTEAFH